MTPPDCSQVPASARVLIARIAAALAVLGLVLLILRQGWVDPVVLQQFIRASGGWAPVLFVATGALTVSLFLPKTVVSVSAGALFGLVHGTLLMVAVAGLAASANYAFARWLAGDWTRRLIERHRHLQLVHAVARSGGFRLQLLLRLAPIHTVLISYAAGIAGVRYGPFLAAAILGIAGQVLWIYAGSQAGAAARSGGSYASWISFGIATLSAILLAVYLPRAVMRQLRKTPVVQNGRR